MTLEKSVPVAAICTGFEVTGLPLPKSPISLNGDELHVGGWHIAVIAAARRSNVSLLLLESGEEWVADHGPRPNEVIESNEKSKLIMDQLDTLEERERQYLVAHFGLDGTDPKTLTEIAKKAGYCTERVRQVVEDALAKMKRKIANGGEGGIEQFLVASGADEVAEGG